MKKIIIILSLLSSIFLVGCNLNFGDNDDSQTSGNVSDPNPSKEYFYPYTGETASEDKIKQTPYMVIIENSEFARPQSGLSQADIVYETSAEGGIPRFLALFHKNQPEKIGPVRSVRPYFLTLTKEHSLPFGHCGGSSDALNEIEIDSTLMSLNEMKNSKSYFRDESRKAPHNLYTNPTNMINLIGEKKLNTPPKQFFKYNTNALDSITETAKDIHVVTNRIYNTTYKFENGSYTKYMDGEKAIDANTNSPLTFKNVIVQQTNIDLSSDGKHLDIDLIGEGKGYLFTNGKKVDITWNKISEYSPTKFFNSKGEEIELTPGNTIINIIDTEGTVSIK